jgi:ATP-dependent RNA helicase DDX49/DBP8
MILFFDFIFLKIVFSIGQDILACAKTGSGKTAAFALPILDVLSDDIYGIFALVLTPTRYSLIFGSRKQPFFSYIRELAYQIADQFRVFGKPLGLKDCVITGGMGKSMII